MEPKTIIKTYNYWHMLPGAQGAGPAGLTIVETCSPHARYAVVSQTPAGWSAELHCVAYDFEPMAKMAESRGQPGWARALRTGSMRQ